MLKRFWRDEEGQDLIEYTLLMAFVCLVGAAIFIPVGSTVGGVWNNTNTVVTHANTIAASAAAQAGS
jgi:Flp pilus assembly pilin Flp